ncbi:MAG: ribonuclease HI family protein [Candidatus Omnitrophica bacterium]|nr:ribonuclease HI family protein [Candidatus Omnitrophota bacterium]
MKLTIYTDGGSRGNPGPAAIGVAIFDDKGKVIKELSKTIGIATNNVAEYSALIYGLQEALFLQAQEISVKLDSEFVVKQLKGEYKVKNENIRPLYYIAKHLETMFSKITITHVPREKNKSADALVNKALDMETLF